MSNVIKVAIVLGDNRETSWDDVLDALVVLQKLLPDAEVSVDHTGLGTVIDTHLKARFL
ncbi:unnamed protein product [marine sediment metagenome]|uniref:Uncharacterized protein n=1 Tax=marine sediment metagenome TaxID=412755 RepID=X0T696_9ZZZZ